MALDHLNASPVAPKRVVVLGAGGFVGTAALRRFRRQHLNLRALGRPELDLLAEDAADQLTAALEPGDSLVVISAKAPCKNAAMLIENLRMFAPVEFALRQVDLAQVIYVSSDAVYADLPVPLCEDSPTAPGALHGVMHLAREIMLREASRAPLAILRPTLIYGADDPHNGYGPNRFRRLAGEGEEIVLFGEGEERRDHVWIEDVAELLCAIVMHRSQGVLNAATGTVVSFKQAAEKVVGQFDQAVVIKGSPRSGPMPHNGYRPFDASATAAAFPDFSYTSFDDGVRKVHLDAAGR